ncbi:hypothetical protein IV203_030277 [Nitzschia inconspicua]|uniref:Uncharacterized protein n=1 Tax=Nitzschia inconspicua TaxID=303405 RepID=A0A9K3LVR8_9STRA|nr:hypothetical protein IV203_030277 [Nitzschia inconspicua]
MRRGDRMRLICCFQDDDIVAAYKKTQDIVRRTPKRKPPDFYDLAIAKFNDTTWVPRSEVLPNLHEDFREAHTYPKRPEYDLDKSRLESTIASQKLSLINIVLRYEFTGRGFVPISEENPLVNFGYVDLEKAMREGGDDRKDYLGDNPTDILYWWHVLDELELLGMLCTMFRRGVGCNSSTPCIPISKLIKRAKRKCQGSDATHQAVSKSTSSLELSTMMRRKDFLMKARYGPGSANKSYLDRQLKDFDEDIENAKKRQKNG